MTPEGIRDLLESLGDDHNDLCTCDGCINVNFPRPQKEMDREFRELCLKLCTTEQLEWHKQFRPETWSVV